MSTAGPVRVQGSADEPPYHVFILTSLALAAGAGFVLATLVPLSIVLDWGWGGRYRPLAQAHGQVLVLGWAGLFILGVAYRLMPRFSGRPLRFPAMVWTSWAAISVALALRLVAQASGGGSWQRAALVGSGALGALAAVAFASVVTGTLAARQSKAGPTAWFFVLGAGVFLAQAALNLALLVQMAQRGDDVVRPIYASGLLHLQLHGFILMFILGVASRAVPTFSGIPRSELGARALAVVLASATVVFVVGALWIASGTRSAGLFRLQAVALAADGPIFLAAVWLVGVFRPEANRMATASQVHIWFVRAAFAWLLVAGGLGAYYGVRAAFVGAPVSPHGVDAVRHALGMGVASVMIVGMAFLLLPEFAIRRMRYPSERWPALLLVALMNAAAALRVGAAVATPQWISPDRYWPMAVGGGLAEGALVLFAVHFLRSLLQKRSIVESQIPVRAAQ